MASLTLKPKLPKGIRNPLIAQSSCVFDDLLQINSSKAFANSAEICAPVHDSSPTALLQHAGHSLVRSLPLAPAVALHEVTKGLSLAQARVLVTRCLLQQPTEL